MKTFMLIAVAATLVPSGADVLLYFARVRLQDVPRVPYTTGWEQRFVEACEADPLPHVGCHGFGGTKLNANPTQSKSMTAFEGGGPSPVVNPSNVVTTCTWR